MSKTITRNEPCASHALLQPRMSETCLKPSELFLSFIQVLFRLQLLFLYCSVEVGFQFLICRPINSSAGNCPVTIWGLLLFRIRKLAGLCFSLRLFALPFSTCLVQTAFTVCTERPAAPLDARWYSGTREDLNTFCFKNRVNSSDASCGPLSETISSGIK